MKVGDSSRPFLDQLGLREEKPVISHRPQFQELFSERNAILQKGEMDALLNSIDELGNRLAKHCSWNALGLYKDKIRQFLLVAVKAGFSIEDRTGRDRRGRMKIYKTVSQIDDLIAELMQEVLHAEKDHLAILDRIGDIRGLLLNLYW